MPASSLPAAGFSRPAPSDSVANAARALVRMAKDADRPLVLAVSGGCDSMALLDAVDLTIAESPRAFSRDRISVVTFDHGTGAHASRAAALVSAEATRRRFVVRAGRASLPAGTEAEWRAARWAFFEKASPPTALIATAHTRDDQLETVVMRAMRGAGARGLAGLAAGRGRVIRPFLGVSRATLRAYAAARGIPFIDDPSNASRAHLRNRIRHDLLPAIRRVRPGFEADMLELAGSAAAWRREVDALAVTFVSEGGVAGRIRVARQELATYDSAALCVLWPAIAARAGITLDRRGTRRLAQFTTEGASGTRIQLSGGVEVVRQRDWFVFRPLPGGLPESGNISLVGVVELRGWRFSPVSPWPSPNLTGPVNDRDSRIVALRGDAWTCDLPADGRLSVRVWRAGDRMRVMAGAPARRVKRFFADARVSGPSRAGWPVVLVDDEIVWIPGIRRSAAASERSGRPVIRYACERFERGQSHS